MFRDVKRTKNMQLGTHNTQPYRVMVGYKRSRLSNFSCFGSWKRSLGKRPFLVLVTRSICLHTYYYHSRVMDLEVWPISGYTAHITSNWTSRFLGITGNGLPSWQHSPIPSSNALDNSGLVYEGTPRILLIAKALGMTAYLPIALWKTKISFENRTSLLHVAAWNNGWNAGAAACLQPVICQEERSPLTTEWG